MKKSVQKLLLCLSLAIPAMSGCSFAVNPSSSQPVDSTSQQGGSQGETTSQGGNTSQSGQTSQGGNTSQGGEGSQGGQTSQEGQEGEGEIEAYTGDPTHSIEEITNVPVTEYSAATKNRLHAVLVDKMGAPESIYEAFLEFMLLLKVGDELAVKFIDLMENYYEFGLQVSGGDVEQAVGQNGETFRALCYDYIAIIKALDLSSSTVSALLARIKELTTESYREELKKLTPIYYRNPSLSGLSYRDFLQLKEHQDVGSAQFKADLAKFQTAFDNYYFSEYELENYNNYRASLESMIENGGIPSIVSNFLSAHASEIQTILVQDLKLLVDAFSTCLRREIWIHLHELSL